MKKLVPYSIEYNLTEHCNLRCYACDHASPLLPTKFASVEEFSYDLHALSEVAHAIQLRLVGGEPLLHPELGKFLAEARRIAVADSIIIFTNGVLLHRTPEEIWDFVDEVRISEYPGVRRRLDDAECARIADAHDVRFHITKIAGFYKTLINNPIDDTDLLSAIFRDCGNTGCHTVHEGRFYRCSAAPFMQQRLGLLGIEFDNRAGDGVALHGNPRLYEELEACLHGRTPLLACSYCLGTSGPMVEHQQLNRQGRSRWQEEDNRSDIEAVRRRLLAPNDEGGNDRAAALAALGENLVVCMGVYRSGLSLVFEVVAALVRRFKPHLRLFACSVERIEDIPLDEVRASDVVVLATHEPDEPLLSFLESGECRMVVTVRDPRDCAVSWRRYLRDPVEYFGGKLARSCATAAALAARKAGAAVVRYESAMQDGARSVAEIAQYLGFSTSGDAAAAILHAINSEKQRSTIPPDDDAGISWLSDQFSGRARGDMLSGAEIASINAGSRAYCKKFGYAMAVPTALSPGRSLLLFTQSSEALEYLEHGFSRPEEGHVWTEDTEAALRIPLGESPNGRLECELRYFAPPQIPGTPTLKAWVAVATNRGEIRQEADPMNQPMVRFVIEDAEFAGLSELSFRICTDRLFCPRDHQMSDDDRKLGLALQSLEVIY